MINHPRHYIGVNKCGGYTLPDLTRIAEDRKSILFDKNKSRYLTKEQSAGDPLTFTIMATVKRSSLGRNQAIIAADAFTPQAAYNYLIFKDDDTLILANGTRVIGSTRSFRDLNSFYHIMAVSTPDVLELWVNGEQIEVTSYDANTATDHLFWNEENYDLTLGKLKGLTSNEHNEWKLDGYITMVGLHEGFPHQDMSAFGDFDYVSNQWIPKDPDTTEWGGNSFYLPCRETIRDDFFNVGTYEGMEPKRIINNISPLGVDMAFVKRYNASQSWVVADRIRGKESAIRFNTDAPELIANGGYIDFIDGGIIMNDEDAINKDNEIYDYFTLKEDAEKGFTIRSYTGTGVGIQKLVHGLVKKPRLAIIKNLNVSAAWHVWVDGITSDTETLLMTNDALQTNPSSIVHWDNSQIDDTYFTVKITEPSTAVNNLGDEYIAYFFANSEGIMDVGYIGDENIPTDGAFDSHSFVANNETYVIISNHFDDSTNDVDSKLYRFDKLRKELIEIQSFPTNAAFRSTSFEKNGNTYVLLTNERSSPSLYSVNSKLYKFDPVNEQLVDTFSILTTGATDCTTFEFNNKIYAIISETYNGTSYDIMQKLYLFDDINESFSEIHSVLGHTCHDWEAFEYNGTFYLLAANYRNGSSYITNSQMFKFDPNLGSDGELVLLQNIPTVGILDWEVFSIGDDVYVLGGFYYNGSSYIINSALYKFNPENETIDFIHDIPTTGCYHWEVFESGGLVYAIASCNTTGSDVNIESTLYRFNYTTSTMELIQSIETNSCRGWETFVVDGEVYAIACNAYNGSVHAINSKMYRFYNHLQELIHINYYHHTGSLKGIIYKDVSSISEWNINYNLTSNSGRTAQLSNQTIPQDNSLFLNGPNGTYSTAGLKNRVYIAFYDTSFLGELTTSSFGRTTFTAHNFTGDNDYTCDSPFDNHATLRYHQHRASIGPELTDGALIATDTSNGAYGHDQLHYGASASRRLHPGQVFEMEVIKAAPNHSAASCPFVIFTEKNRPTIFTVDNDNFRADLGYKSDIGQFSFYKDIKNSVLHSNALSSHNQGLQAGDVLTVQRTDTLLVAYLNGAVATTLPMDETFPAIQVHFSVFSGTEIEVNFGQRNFIYPPSGTFKTMSSIGTIDSYPIDKPNEYFNIAEYVGNGISSDIPGINFNPDLMLFKSISNTDNWNLIDSTRGLNFSLSPNNSNIEGIDNYITSKSETEVTVGDSPAVNSDGRTYDVYCWKESICSGLAVRAWNGTGGARIIDHNLGRNIDIAWIKERDLSTDWRVFVRNVTDDANTNALSLNNTSGTENISPYWDFTNSDSDGFGLLDAGNLSSTRYVGYFWAEVPGFSSFGSLRGGGINDPVFIECGFKPALIIIKRYDLNGFSWVLKHKNMDNGYNEFSNGLFLDNTNSSNQVQHVEFLSNGFKIKENSGHINADTGEYLYMAFADVNDILSNAR